MAVYCDQGTESSGSIKKRAISWTAESLVSVDYNLLPHFVQATRKASIFIQGGVITCEQMHKAKITGVDAMLQNMLKK